MFYFFQHFPTSLFAFCHTNAVEKNNKYELFSFRKSIECNMAGVTAFSLSEVEEGSEPDEFWTAIGGKKYYCSLAHGKFFVHLHASHGTTSVNLE